MTATSAPDLTTGYLGFRLSSPLVVSSSPLCREIDNLRAMEEAGAGAIVLHSLFEEQIDFEDESLDRVLLERSGNSAEAMSYFPETNAFGGSYRAYLDHVTRAKRAVSIQLMGSLNGVSKGGWVRFAHDIQEAGADALELNIYFVPASLETTSSEIEDQYCDLVHEVKSRVQIPVAVKIGPWFTSMANMACRLDTAGADALVLFNRFYQPDFDLEALEVKPNLELSTSAELRLRLHWVALLANRIRPDLAITGGVHTAEDVAKGIVAGAKVVMLTSALLLNGITHLGGLRRDLIRWMTGHEYESVRQMRGAMNADAVAEPAAFYRANYLKVLGSYMAATQR
jgi:dihydroorotate dehydrogenase (fumarate)